MNKNELLGLLTLEIKFKNSKAAILRESLFFGLAVLLILFPFRPFGLSDENILYLFYICLGMSISTFIPIFLNLLFIKKKLFEYFNRKWFLKYEVVLFIIILPQVCVLNFFYSSLVINLMDFSITGFLRISLYSSVLITIIFFIKNALIINNRYHEELVTLSTKLEYFKELEIFKSLNQNSENSIILTFENEDISLQLNKIILISAWGNYIKILIETNKNSIELVKRGKMKDIESQLLSYPQFYRCHRSFIVNLNYIKKVTGNAKKSDIILNTKEIRIPVSRENISRITKFLDELRKKEDL